jgi:YD repeat-containing protein
LYVGTDGRLHGELWMGNATKAMASGALVNDGKWHHAVIAAGTNTQTLYLDGNAVATLAGALVDQNSSNVYIGAGESDGGWPFHPTNTLGYFQGSIGEVGFYRSQLSAAQVAAHYAAYGAGAAHASPTQINTLVDPAGKTETYKYDATHGDRLISQTDGTGATTTYGYDTSGFPYTMTDPNGDVTTTAHDVRGNVVSQTTCQDREDQACSTDYYTYWPDDTTAILTTADARNDLVTSARDGRSASATDSTYATTYGYDTAGNRISTTTPPVPGSPNGRTTTQTYSDGTTAFPAADSGNVPAGLPMTTVSPGGATTRTAYFHNGDVASTTDANGLVTLYGYDNLGHVTTKTVNPGGPVGWWKLNQTSGTTVADSAGVGNGATASNVTWSGGVGVFNGTTSQIVTAGPVLNTATSFTMSAWANLSKIPPATRSSWPRRVRTTPPPSSPTRPTPGRGSSRPAART